MATLETKFLEEFKSSFENDKRFMANTLVWLQGNTKENTAHLKLDESIELRRAGFSKKQSEQFELGNLRTSFKDWTIIVEHDNDGILLANLLKYSAFVKGMLDVSPSTPNVLLCHFSSWRSYGTHRDLWQWIKPQIENDNKNKHRFVACQFDHGFDKTGIKNQELRNANIKKALNWISSLVNTKVI